MKNSIRIVFCTCPPTLDVHKLAHELVEQQLAACVNIIPKITSVYTWKDQIFQEDEILLMIKTTEKAYPRLEVWIRQHHPYEIPEIIALPIIAGFDPYLKWILTHIGK